MHVQVGKRLNCRFYALISEQANKASFNLISEQAIKGFPKMKVYLSMQIRGLLCSNIEAERQEAPSMHLYPSMPIRIFLYLLISEKV